MNYVWESSKQKGSSLLLLLAIADHAHDDGTGAYPSIDALAKKTRMSVRNTQYALRRLEASGELSVSLKAGPKDVNVYCIPLPAVVQSLQVQEPAVVQSSVQGGASQRQGVVQNLVEGGATGCTQTVIEPSVLTVKEERVRARRNTKIDEALILELQDQYPTIDVRWLAEKIALYEQSHGKPYKDHRATLRVWCGDELKRQKERGVNGNRASPSAPHEEFGPERYAGTKYRVYEPSEEAIKAEEERMAKRDAI